jgi:transposase
MVPAEANSQKTSAMKRRLAQHPTKKQSQRSSLLRSDLYRARNLVERFFNKIKQCRRIATRYDKLAANYLAFIQLASIRLWLRANESTPWSEHD